MFGCGTGSWGDVRLDIAKTYLNRKTTLNILADAHALPFKDKVFYKTKCHHLLEHLPRWREAIKELCRVTLFEVEIEVPVDAGFAIKTLCKKVQKFSFFPMDIDWNYYASPRILMALRFKHKPTLEYPLVFFSFEYSLCDYPFRLALFQQTGSFEATVDI